VDEKKQEIEKTLTELEEMKEDATTEKKALADMRREKKKELKNFNRKMKKKQKQANEYAKQAADAEEKVEKLLEEKQREIDLQNDMGNGNSGGGGKLRWPLNVSGRISSGFGKRSSPTAGASTYHKGLDIAVPSGTPIVAAASGTVVTSTYSSSAGNFIMISHGNRLYTVYMHCSKRAVSVGDKVSKGEVIGYAGSTGISTGSHLHFGVSKNGSYVNPLNYVKQG
jgi:murein DD-endopeptidase MepM/ murein hydrolase activator NlpD